MARWAIPAKEKSKAILVITRVAADELIVQGRAWFALKWHRVGYSSPPVQLRYFCASSSPRPAKLFLQLRLHSKQELNTCHIPY